MVGWLNLRKRLSRISTNGQRPNRLFPRGLKRALRRVFEYKKIRQVLGIKLLSAAVLLSQVAVPASASQSYPQAELVTLPATVVGGVNEIEEIEVETKTGFQIPVENFRISQGYHLLHLGIDLAAPSGSPIKPIAQGKVEQVEYSHWGYGNNLLINHGSNLKSFYAHLGKIGVKEGEEVSIDDIIGTVGTSGRSTGPHLHLEIWQNDRPLNPRVVLALQVESYLVKSN